MKSINDFNADQKILRYMDKLDYFFNGHKTLIVTELDLTNKCNNRCPNCCGINANGAELSKEQIERIANDLYAMDNKGVILSGGGEPLLSPHFAYALQLLHSKGMRIGLNSNGLALTEEKAKQIAKQCAYFRISLDAATPEMYKKTHGMPKEALEKVIANAKMFRKVKEELNSSINFGIGFLTNRETATEMDAFVRLCQEIGADFDQFRPFTEDDYDITDQYLALKNKYETENFQVKASKQKYQYMYDAPKRQYDRCRGMFFSTVITADAKVFACLHHRQDEQFYLGDLDKQTLEDIFLSPRIREVYQNMDCSKCLVLCRNDIFNKTLAQLADKVYDSEFL